MGQSCEIIIEDRDRAFSVPIHMQEDYELESSEVENLMCLKQMMEEQQFYEYSKHI